MLYKNQIRICKMEITLKYYGAVSQMHLFSSPEHLAGKSETRRRSASERAL